MSKHIESRDNPTFKHLRKLCDNRRERVSVGLYAVVGEPFLLREALARGVAVDTVVCTPVTAQGLDLPDSVALLTLSDALMESLVPLESTASVLFTCPLPTASPDWAALKRGRHVVLDGLQDPGNVGTVLRTAAAFGFDSVLTTEGCADAYALKTLRAAAGALFTLPVFAVKRAELAAWIVQEALPCYVAAHRETAVAPEALRGQEGLLVIGAEAAGISPELQAVATATVSIPMQGDSLNAAVAGGILLYEMTR